LALWGTRLLLKWAPEEIPRCHGIRFDPMILCFALAITTVTGLLI